MLTIKPGDIFEQSSGIIVHQVNCRGVMGAGIALEIRKRYPKVFSAYSRACQSALPGELLGKVQVVHVTPTLYIANLFAQDEFSRTTPCTNYSAFRSCFSKIEQYAAERNLPVHIPYKIGCGLAGGKWEECLDILGEIFGDSPAQATIWKKV